MSEYFTNPKHGDKKEIITTTIIPESTVQRTQPITTKEVITTEKLPMSQTTFNQNLPSSMSENVYTSQQPIITQTQPIYTEQVPVQTGVNQGSGTTVRKIIDTVTVEHHSNKKETLKHKVKDAKDKILGFIPNPFSKGTGTTTDNTTETHEGLSGKINEGNLGMGTGLNTGYNTGLNTGLGGAQQTTTTTTYPSNQGNMPITKTVEVHEYPAQKPTTNLKCDKKTTL